MIETASPDGQASIQSTRVSRSITVAKGMGIIMVVIGHTFPNECPTYWKFIHDTIYKFHMPLFLIISGYLYSKSIDYQVFSLAFLKKKFNRLIIPFIVIALFAFAIKYFAGFFVNLLHPVKLNSLILIFITSRGTYFPLLWFIYSLFIIFIIFPIFQKVLQSKYLIFLVSILLMFIQWPNTFYLKHVFSYLPFFSFGALFLKKINFDHLEKRVLYFTIAGLILFILASFINNSIGYNSIYSKIISIILGVSGSITIISLATINSQFMNLGQMLHLIGFYSMSIYLLHTFFSSTVLIINYQLLKTNYFLLPAIVAIFAGIFSPLILEKYVIRKNYVMRKYILGLR